MSAVALMGPMECCGRTIGVGGAADVDAVDEVEGFGHQVQVERSRMAMSLLRRISRESNGLRKFTPSGTSSSCPPAWQGAGRGRMAALPPIDLAIELGAVLDAASERIAREDGEAGG